MQQPGATPATAAAFLGKLYRNVPVLDTGARASLTTVAQRGIGDVIITWENEAYMATARLPRQQLETVVPSVSILAEPPVAVVDKVAVRRGTLDVARAYVEHLYSPQAQEIAAKHHYRPRDPQVAARYASLFPQIRMWTIADFGGWEKANATHFANGAEFDRIYQRK
ncbi:MAG: sulfate ABC transporter substrate-binding protein, partial [Steroidobacteraceae bacterium]